MVLEIVYKLILLQMHFKVNIMSILYFSEHINLNNNSDVFATVVVSYNRICDNLTFIHCRSSDEMIIIRTDFP